MQATPSPATLSSKTAVPAIHRWTSQGRDPVTAFTQTGALKSVPESIADLREVNGGSNKVVVSNSKTGESCRGSTVSERNPVHAVRIGSATKTTMAAHDAP
tara:strand:+ start:230 stop:532 length:303 start_codon:yes stop_codon:yes gene_type:complete